MTTTSRWNLTGRKAIVATGFAIIAGGALFVFGRAIVTAREAARFESCRNNLKQIALALHKYHDAFDSFPPAVVYGPDGKPWHSWRVLIAPQLECSDFYSRYRMDEPWNGPNNQKLVAEQVWPVFHCSTDPSDPSNTSYLAVVGEGTLWPTDDAASLDDATDPSATVIHVVEVSDSGVHWMEPRDLRLDSMSFRLNEEGEALRSQHLERGWLRDGAPRVNVIFADGHTEPVTGEATPDQIRSMLLTSDREPPAVP